MLGQEALVLGALVALVLREGSLVALVSSLVALVLREQHHGVASLAWPRGQAGQLGRERWREAPVLGGQGPQLEDGQEQVPLPLLQPGVAELLQDVLQGDVAGVEAQDEQIGRAHV